MLCTLNFIHRSSIVSDTSTILRAALVVSVHESISIICRRLKGTQRPVTVAVYCIEV